MKSRGDDVLTGDEAAELLRVHVQTVLKESREARLLGFEIGCERRYSRRALLARLRRYTGEEPGPPPADPVPVMSVDPAG